MIPEQQNPSEKPANIAEIAQKQRYIHLLDKVKQGKPVTKAEIKELAKYEKHKTEIASTQVTSERRLTFKQQKFVACFDGCIKSTAEKAGLSYDYCRRLVTKSHILQAIWARQTAELRPEIATRLQRQKFWSDLMVDTNADMNDRLKASELLGKSEADFTENVNGKIVYVSTGIDIDALHLPFEFRKQLLDAIRNRKKVESKTVEEPCEPA